MRSKRKSFLSIALLISTTIFIIAHLIYSSAQQDKEYPKKMSDLAFDNLNLDSHPGVGFELIFESDELIIFYGDFGLFGYNLKEQKMIFGGCSGFLWDLCGGFIRWEKSRVHIY